MDCIYRVVGAELASGQPEIMAHGVFLDLENIGGERQGFSHCEPIQTLLLSDGEMDLGLRHCRRITSLQERI